MNTMTNELAVRAGGWDPRYAVVRALVSTHDLAAALIDPNGDGASIDVDEYHHGPDGNWIANSSSGGPGEAGTSWSPHMVTTYGRTDPGAQILINYCGEAHSLTADTDGWWLFATRSLDEHSMPEIRIAP